MKLYKYKIFHIGFSQYEEIEGSNSWYSVIDVAKAFDSIKDKRYVEVHQICLTTICVLE